MGAKRSLWGGNSKQKNLKMYKKVLSGDSEDDQKRFIQATFKWKRKKITIMNGYFPQGENRSHETKFPKKIKFYDDLEKHIKKLKKIEEEFNCNGRL